MDRMVHASRAEHGCIEYAYSEDIQDPGLINVKELGLDQDVLDQHFASEKLQQFERLRASARDSRVFLGAPAP